MTNTLALFAAVFVGVGTLRSEAALINEVLIEPSGPEFGQQFFELKGLPSESLAGVSFLSLIGEAADSGIIDEVLDLSAFSLGSNGLLLWRDTPPVLSPAPDAATTIVVGGFGAPGFFPEISKTFVLVRGFTGFQGQDLDTNNDGVLDIMPWTSVDDAIGVRENDMTPANEFVFGTQLGFADFPVTGFDPDAIFRDGRTDLWYATDVSNPLGGPFSFDGSEFVDINLNAQALSSFTVTTMTPGSANAAVPEPASLVLLGFAGLLFGARRILS